MTQIKAAELLGISDRQFRRLCKAYKVEGAAGLISKKRGKPSNNRIADPMKKKALKLLREVYVDFKLLFSCEKLREEHGLQVSRETVRLWMIAAGLWSTKSRPKAQIHQS